jgi:hypothetical protein
MLPTNEMGFSSLFYSFLPSYLYTLCCADSQIWAACAMLQGNEMGVFFSFPIFLSFLPP